MSDYGHKGKKGFVGFSTEGPNRYYFSEKLPRGEKSAKDETLFNPDMYDLIASMFYEENRGDRQKVGKMQSFLEKVGYLPDDSVDSLYGNMTQGAGNRYIKNFEEEMGLIPRLTRYLKGL
tara:strand:- start:145 stop:504 length:360 start_codon:yes stop_codon:yes gene_type:complete